MNRRKFLQYLGLGALSAPVAAKAIKQPPDLSAESMVNLRQETPGNLSLGRIFKYEAGTTKPKSFYIDDLEYLKDPDDWYIKDDPSDIKTYPKNWLEALEYDVARKTHNLARKSQKYKILDSKGIFGSNA